MFWKALKWGGLVAFLLVAAVVTLASLPNGDDQVQSPSGDNSTSQSVPAGKKFNY